MPFISALTKTGAVLSSENAPLLLVAVFPAVSVAVLATMTAPWPSVVRSPAVRATDCAAPFPVRVLVTLPAVPVNNTLTLAPVSAVTLSTPAAASAAVLSASPAALTLRAGATVSSTKPPAVLVAAFPAASVAVASTVTAPSPRVVRSAEDSTAACAAPLPVRALVTTPDWPVRTTLTALPDSAVTLRTPPPAVASAAVLAASPEPVTFKAGAELSRRNPPVALVLALPAVSVAVVSTATGPSPKVVSSAELSAMVCAAPLPVRVLVTLPELPELPVNTALTLAPLSATTLSTPPAAAASVADLFESPTAATVTVGAMLSRLKPPVLLEDVLPARSVAVLVTVTAPWPKVVTSPTVSVIDCGAPVPVSVLVTLPAVPVRTTLTFAPLSAVTLRTPAAASVAVLFASPAAATISDGGVASTVMPSAADAALVFAARSVRVAVRECAPPASVVRVTSTYPAVMFPEVSARLATRVAPE